MRTPTTASSLLCLLLSTSATSPAHASSTQARQIPPSPFTCPTLPPTASLCPAHNPPPPSLPQPPPPPANNPPPSTPGTAAPWTRSPICRRAAHLEFCAFTLSTFPPYGITLITTPSRILLLGSQPSLNLTSPSPPPPNDPTSPSPPPLYTPTPIPNKGLGLVATALIRAGTRVMRATPAVMVDDGAFRGLRRGDLKVLLGQGVMGLPASGREGFLGLSASAAGEDGEGDDGVLDRVWRIFSTNAFRTTVKGVLEGKVPEGEVEFHSTFVEGESPPSRLLVADDGVGVLTEASVPPQPRMQPQPGVLLRLGDALAPRIRRPRHLSRRGAHHQLRRVRSPSPTTPHQTTNPYPPPA